MLKNFFLVTDVAAKWQNELVGQFFKADACKYGCSLLYGEVPVLAGHILNNRLARKTRRE